MIEKGATDFNTAMREAAGEGHLNIVKYMIEKGATGLNKSMKSAAKGGHLDIVKYLIEIGGDKFNVHDFDSAIKAADDRKNISDYLSIEKRRDRNRKKKR